VATILETARLLLRELVPGDLDFVATMLANPDVARYYARTFDRSDAEIWLQRQLDRYRRDGHGLWLVEDRATGAPVGQIGLALQEVEGEQLPEIGWLLHRPFWGRGYATEAGGATRDAAFGRWGYPRVISLIRPENAPSQRVAERLGMAPGRRVDFHGYVHIVFQASRSATPATC
jgi:RimJ/RimL family protein N-acetyltransferase